MKIKLQDYSLISNEWINEHIKDPLQSHLIKQQLIPSEKLADEAFTAGSCAAHYTERAYFLNSEIEIE